MGTEARLEIRIDEKWEVVHVGFGPGAEGFIGRVVSEGPEEVTLCPVFQYSSNTIIGAKTERGRSVDVERFAVPVEVLGSDVPERVRWTRRRRLVDYDPADRRVFEQVLAGALALREKKREERLVASPADLGADPRIREALADIRARNGRAG